MFLQDHVTILFGAAACGNTSIVKTLLDKGIDVNVKYEVS